MTSPTSVVVAKFGGTSVANYEAMQRCAAIVENDPTNRVVVVSASSGVTNLLVELGQEAVDKQEQQRIIAEISSIQQAIIDCLEQREQAQHLINDILQHLTELAQIQAENHSAKIADAILACGELMSSWLFTFVLNERGIKATRFDIRTVLKTNSLYGKAVVDIEALAHNAQQLLTPLLAQQVVVTQGFIGEDGLGNTTTLGRGGSDYSAALIAEAIHADKLAIWTDVEGIFTTDPRITEQARSIAEISFGEAAEMATFGAKILHPATLIPAMRRNIPVFVGSSKAPEKGGTEIRKTVESAPTYRSIALRKQQTLVTVKSPAMLHASGFLSQVFGILAKHELSVDLITTSEISVALTFDNPPGTTQAQLTTNAVKELEQLSEVTVEHGLALVAIIGNGLNRSLGLGERVFNQLNDVNIRMICHGASANNICFLVDEAQANTVVERLHRALFN
jgi:aspartate kinase